MTEETQPPQGFTRRLGYLLPFHLDRHKTSAGDYSWPVAHATWNGGKMDSWMTANYQIGKGIPQDIPLLMGYFEEEDLPFHRALADAFTICDRYH